MNAFQIQTLALLILWAVLPAMGMLFNKPTVRLYRRKASDNDSFWTGQR